MSVSRNQATNLVFLNFTGRESPVVLREQSCPNLGEKVRFDDSLFVVKDVVYFVTLFEPHFACIDVFLEKI